MRSYSEEWEEGEYLVKMLGGREHLALFLGVRSVSLRRHFGSEVCCIARFEIDGEEGYETTLVLKFKGIGVDVKFFEVKRSILYFFRPRIYISTGICPLKRIFYAFIPNSIDAVDLQSLVNCVDFVTKRSLDPFGVLYSEEST